MEECLAYFRKAIADPASVPPWSEWWAVNAELVERIFPLFDFVRLKHRRLLGARQILQKAGELPKDYSPRSPLLTGSCGQCGERVTGGFENPDGSITCPTCGLISIDESGERGRISTP
jgi:ribosomal protein S27E